MCSSALPSHTPCPADLTGATTSSLTFYPEKVWGLDHIFYTFNKLYICDILKMQPYPTFPGAFAYKNHPIYRVDIAGTVVKVDEKPKLFLYGVDDGTGVLSCTCWKNEGNHVNIDCDLPEELQVKMKSIAWRTEELTEGYQLGDFVHVRGRLQIFRESMEVIASNHSKVTDQMYQVLRMTELPLIYHAVYDRPFSLPHKVSRELLANQQDDIPGQTSQWTLAKQLTKTVRGHLQNRGLTEVCLEDLIQNCKIKRSYGALPNIDKSKYKLKSLLAICIQQLEEEGFLCKMLCGCVVSYQVLCSGCHLESAIVDIINIDSTKPKYLDKGCHYLHILDELRKNVRFSKVQKVAVLVCLHNLELSSAVFSSSDHHYVLCS